MKQDKWYHFWVCQNTHRFCVAEVRNASGGGVGNTYGEFYLDPIYDKCNRKLDGDNYHFQCDCWFMKVNFKGTMKTVVYEEQTRFTKVK